MASGFDFFRLPTEIRLHILQSLGPDEFYLILQVPRLFRDAIASWRLLEHHILLLSTDPQRKQKEQKESEQERRRLKRKRDTKNHLLFREYLSLARISLRGSAVLANVIDYEPLYGAVDYHLSTMALHSNLMALVFEDHQIVHIYRMLPDRLKFEMELRPFTSDAFRNSITQTEICKLVFSSSIRPELGILCKEWYGATEGSAPDAKQWPLPPYHMVTYCHGSELLAKRLEEGIQKFDVPEQRIFKYRVAYPLTTDDVRPNSMALATYPSGDLKTILVGGKKHQVDIAVRAPVNVKQWGRAEWSDVLIRNRDGRNFGIPCSIFSYARDPPLIRVDTNENILLMHNADDPLHYAYTDFHDLDHGAIARSSDIRMNSFNITLMTTPAQIGAPFWQNCDPEDNVGCNATYLTVALKLRTETTQRGRGKSSQCTSPPAYLVVGVHFDDDPDACNHGYAADLGLQFVNQWKAATALAGSERKFKSGKFTMATEVGNSIARVCMAFDCDVLVWTFNIPELLEMMVLRGDDVDEESLDQSIPVELRSPGQVQQLWWADMSTLYAKTRRGIRQWRMDEHQMGVKETKYLRECQPQGNGYYW